MKYKIGDLMLSISDTKKMVETDEVVFLNTGDILDGKILHENYSKIIDLPGQAKKSIKNHDILYSEIRPKNKRFALVEVDNPENYVVSTKLMVLRSKSNSVKIKYLYYFLTSSKVVEYLQNQAESRSGTFPQITFQELKNIEINLPSVEKQEKIVEFMSSLDSKIELNNQIIATLEELAATLFKRWFVDFEFPDENGNPYKSSGGKMVDSELGEIPEGWEVGALNDIGNIVGGGTPSKKNLEYYEGGEIPWITPKDLSDQKTVFISKGKVSITPLGLQKSSAKMIPEKSILFSSRAPIGYIAISRQPVSTNQGFKSVVPINSRWSVFIYLLLQYSVINIESRATGSTFKEISGTAMKNFPIIIPTKLIIDDFSKTVNPIFHKIDYIEKEVRSLEKVRNILLPKLLSGEIEV